MVPDISAFAFIGKLHFLSVVWCNRDSTTEVELLVYGCGIMLCRYCGRESSTSLAFLTVLCRCRWGSGAFIKIYGFIPSLVRMFSAEMRHMGTPTPGAIVPPT